ncbi:MAG: hypothetical protein MK132_13260 [Lentisphaerales bacterium]|nr:hypothetical protein [Lentisphaerales bacterium]
MIKAFAVLFITFSLQLSAQEDTVPVEEVKPQTNVTLTQDKEDAELVDSPSIEEADIPEEKEELVKEVEVILGEEGLSSAQGEDSTLKINQRSKSLRIYAILLLLLVIIIFGLASLFQPNKSEHN